MTLCRGVEASATRKKQGRLNLKGSILLPIIIIILIICTAVSITLIPSLNDHRVRGFNSPLRLTFSFLFCNASASASAIPPPPPLTPAGGSPLPCGPVSPEEPPTCASLRSRILVLSTFLSAAMPPAPLMLSSTAERVGSGVGIEAAAAGTPDA